MKTKKISRIVGVGVTLSLLASLLIGALPVSANVSSATVTLSTTQPVTDAAYTISKLNNYTITFDVSVTVPEATGWIDVQFPLGTIIQTLADGDISVQSTAGFGTMNAETAVLAANVTVTNNGSATLRPAVRIAIDDLAADIGEAAAVRVKFKNLVVRNAPAVGDHTLLVDTSETGDTTAVASQVFTLIAPTIPGVPGVVQGYNASDILIFEQTGAGVIQAAVDFVGITRIVIGPGTYDEMVTVGATDTVTSIVSSAGAATTIIADANNDGGEGTLIIQKTLTVDGLTIAGSALSTAAKTVDIQVASVTVRNCIITARDTTGVNAALEMGAGGATTPAISSGNTFSVPGATVGINVLAGVTGTSTGDTFNVADTAGGTNGTGIMNSGTLTVSGGTFAGTSGLGINSAIPAAITTITGSSFTTLDQAVMVTDGKVTMTSNTIDGCGVASTTVPRAAIYVAVLTAPVTQNTVTVTGNTIINSPENILESDANANFIYVNFNTLTGNVGSFDNDDGANTLDATNNWWGTSAGPAVASEGLVKVQPWILAEISNPVVVAGTGTLTGQATVGVNVTIQASGGTPGTGSAAIMLAGTYAGNPGTAPPPADAKSFTDIYVSGIVNPAHVATLTFFGITTSGARVWGWSEVQNTWVLCSVQVVDLFQGAVVVTISPTSSPNTTNLSGMAFCLSEPSYTPPAAPAQASLVPAVAAEDVRTTLTSFTWGAVAGAASYDFELAPYLADSSDPFIPALTILSVSVDTNGIILLNQVLDYEETYAWRVRTVRGTDDVSAWVTSFFTTAAEPPPDEGPPTWIIEQEPTQIEWPDDITIVIPPIEKTEIPEYILWVIVAVGAILVIAVVVLIVRTRRVA